MVKTRMKKSSHTFGRRKWERRTSPENMAAKIPAEKDLPKSREHKTETKKTSHDRGSPKNL
jgi:hypothetical protein